MLKTLLKKQISETLSLIFRKGSKKRNVSGKPAGIGRVIMVSIALLYVTALFTFCSDYLCKQLVTVEMGWLYYLLTGCGAILFGTFGSIFTTCFTLYMAKDNDLLLSMPIPIRDIILSRLFAVYLMGLLYSGMVSIPSVVVGWVIGGVRFSGVIGGIVFILLISLIVLGLSCLLGWGVAKISQRLKNRSFLTVLIALVFVGLYYYVYFQVMNRTKDLLTAVIGVGESIRGSAYPIYMFGQIGEGDWLSMLCWTGAVLLLLGLIWLVLKKTFLSISTATPSPKKAVYREKATRQSSVSAALLRREWFRFSSSANYMLNCGMALLFLLGFGGYMLFRGNVLLKVIPMASEVMRESVPVLLCALCCMLVGMIDISAPSVSLEGCTIWQVQCLPVTPWQVLRAKLLLHLGLSAIPALFCIIVLLCLTPAAFVQKLLMLAVAVLYAVLFALLGLCLGVKMPNLNWTNEIVPIKQSASTLISIFSGMGLSAAFGILYLLFGWHLGATAWLGIFALLLLGVDLSLNFWLKGPGSRRFAAL